MILALIPAIIAGNGGASAQQTQVGRYQMMTAAPSPSQASPEIFLFDSATGQTWRLVHESEPAIHWQPVRFSSGKDRPLTPLPPGPDVVGASR
ncbi:MAG TPA: hypothetical protein VMI72_17790 [Roseiarcus sp.]|nr:hypothetical protein [Roseiarcus sp.]